MTIDNDNLNGANGLPEPRIPPLGEADWTPEIREIFTIFEGEAARERGTEFNILKTLAHHPSLVSRFLAYEYELLRNATIPERIREIIILRLAWLYQQQYEWKQHVAIARSIGMSEEEIAATRRGADDGVWTALDRHVLNATDQAFGGVTVTNETWAGLAAHFDHSQMLEVLFTIGTFAMMSWVFNSTGLQLEEPGRCDQT
jgi:4-carboxymuconolactone decarboxylase